MAGFSIVKNSSTGEPFDISEGYGKRVLAHMRDEGHVLPRNINDEILLAPPLVVNAEEIDQIISATVNAISEVM